MAQVTPSVQQGLKRVKIFNLFSSFLEDKIYEIENLLKYKNKFQDL